MNYINTNWGMQINISERNEFQEKVNQRTNKRDESHEFSSVEHSG